MSGVFEKRYEVGLPQRAIVSPDIDATGLRMINNTLYYLGWMNRYNGLTEFVTFMYSQKGVVYQNTDKFKFVDKGLITNSGDGIISRLQQEPSLKPLITLTMACDGGCFYFEVDDNGVGIDPEVEPQIFDRIVSNKKRLPFNIGSPYSGGLGIHMLESQEIVESSGGSIHFENKGHNQGARFWYEVPVEALLR